MNFKEGQICNSWQLLLFIVSSCNLHFLEIRHGQNHPPPTLLLLLALVLAPLFIMLNDWIPIGGTFFSFLLVQSASHEAGSLWCRGFLRAGGREGGQPIAEFSLAGRQQGDPGEDSRTENFIHSQQCWGKWDLTHGVIKVVIMIVFC